MTDPTEPILSAVTEEGSIFELHPDDEPTTLGETKPTNAYTDNGSEKKPTRIHSVSREPVAELITVLWGSIGFGLIQTGADIPVGRVMQFQAPMAGAKIDALLAGTWLDKLLQPLASQVEKVEGVGALLAFPLLVGAYERNPALGVALEPIMRQVVHSTLVDMAPAIKANKRKEQAAAKAIVDISDAFDLKAPDGTPLDPIDAVLGMIFQHEPEGEYVAGNPDPQ